MDELLTLEEASDTSMFANDSARRNGKHYWLGSAYSSYSEWVVAQGGYISDGSACTSSSGVRPVIEISTSDIQ